MTRQKLLIDAFLVKICSSPQCHWNMLLILVYVHGKKISILVILLYLSICTIGDAFTFIKLLAHISLVQIVAIHSICREFFFSEQYEHQMCRVFP